jgi:anion transporter
MTGSKWLKLLISTALGLAVYLMPAMAGLSRTGQTLFAIVAFTVGLWVMQVMNNAIASILMMALMIPAGIPPGRAFSGFSDGAFWVLLAVLYYGFAMQHTGLAQRISYYILSLFPPTYSGLLGAFFAIGAVLALGIPSMTVRTAIMAPIAWALVQSLGLESRSRGSALIMLTTVEMAVVPGIGLLYGSLFGPVVQKVFERTHLPLSWLGYAAVLEVPTLILCALIVVGNQVVLRPEKGLDSSREFVRGKLRDLGAFRRPEVITAMVVSLSIVFWATDRIHHLPSFFIGMLGLAVFAVAGIVRDQDIAGGVSWTLLIFMGGIFGLANVIQDYKITDWLAGFFVPVAESMSFNALVFLLAVAIAMFAVRFIDPSGFIAIPVLFLPVVAVSIKAGIPPLVLTAAILLPSVPFWATYQNIWVAMGDGITSGKAFTAGQRVRLATVYGVAVMMTIVVSAGYWKLTGAF